MFFYVPHCLAMNLYEMIQQFEILAQTKSGRQYTEAQIILLLNQSQQLLYPYMPDEIMENFISGSPVHFKKDTVGGTYRPYAFTEVTGTTQQNAMPFGAGIYKILRWYDYSDSLSMVNWGRYVYTRDVPNVLGNTALAGTGLNNNETPIMIRRTADIVEVHGKNLNSDDTLHVFFYRYPKDMVGFVKPDSLHYAGKKLMFSGFGDRSYWVKDYWAGRWITNYGPDHTSRTKYLSEKTNDSEAVSAGTNEGIRIAMGAGSYIVGRSAATDEFSFDSDYPGVVHPIICMMAAYLAEIGGSSVSKAGEMDRFIKSIVAPLYANTENKSESLRSPGQ